MIWQWLLRGLAARAASQVVRETVFSAAREELEKSAQRRESPPDPPRADVAVVFALGAELGGFEDLLSGVLRTEGQGFLLRQGLLETRPVILLETGAGSQAARRGTEALLTVHRPRWIISAGFAGGLQSRLKRYDLLMADELVDLEGRRLTIDFSLGADETSHRPGLRVGRLLTVDRLIRRPEEKLALGKEHQAAAVDMETFAVAEVCRRERIRFLAVRIISDAVDEELPKEIENLLVQKTTSRRLGAAVGALLNRPSSVKDMLALKETALIASDRLAKFLAGIIPQLPPEAPKE